MVVWFPRNVTDREATLGRRHRPREVLAEPGGPHGRPTLRGNFATIGGDELFLVDLVERVQRLPTDRRRRCGEHRHRHLGVRGPVGVEVVPVYFG